MMYVPASGVHAPTLSHPIALSYVDVIGSGALDVSKSFADNFFGKCEGWDVILDDRANPEYESAVRVSEADRAYIDAQLRSKNVRVVTRSKM